MKTGSRSRSPQNETMLLSGLLAGLSWRKSLCRRLESRSLRGPQTPWFRCLDEVRSWWSGALQPQRVVSRSFCPDQHAARLDLFCSVWRLLIPSFTSIFKTPQATRLIPLSSLASYCVNGIKNSEPMPEEGWGGDIYQCETVCLNSIRSPQYCSIVNSCLEAAQWFTADLFHRL